jgi:hypothetical protein
VIYSCMECAANYLIFTSFFGLSSPIIFALISIVSSRVNPAFHASHLIRLLTSWWMGGADLLVEVSL